MPDRLDKALMLIGLSSYLAGQIWINITGSMTKDEIAVDGIHWLMLIGAALIIPFAARLPRQGLSLVASPLLLIGIVLIIGMCVLDFVFWSIPDPEFSGLVAGELAQTAPVWKPFIVYAGWIFTPALMLTSLLYWQFSRIGPLLAVAGGVVIAVWPIWSNPYGYSAIILAFLICFHAEANAD